MTEQRMQEPLLAPYRTDQPLNTHRASINCSSINLNPADNCNPTLMSIRADDTATENAVLLHGRVVGRLPNDVCERVPQIMYPECCFSGRAGKANVAFTSQLGLHVGGVQRFSFHVFKCTGAFLARLVLVA